MNQPTCGKCGKVMTPADSKIHPEYFLHDACLPEELKPPARTTRQPTHLGDGAYAIPNDNDGIVVTANDHDIRRATDKVFLDRHAVEALCRWYFGEETWRRMADAGRRSDS